MSWHLAKLRSNTPWAIKASDSRSGTHSYVTDEVSSKDDWSFLFVYILQITALSQTPPSHAFLAFCDAVGYEPLQKSSTWIRSRWKKAVNLRHFQGKALKRKREWIDIWREPGSIASKTWCSRCNGDIWRNAGSSEWAVGISRIYFPRGFCWLDARTLQAVCLHQDLKFSQQVNDLSNYKRKEKHSSPRLQPTYWYNLSDWLSYPRLTLALSEKNQKTELDCKKWRYRVLAPIYKSWQLHSALHDRDSRLWIVEMGCAR